MPGQFTSKIPGTPYVVIVVFLLCLLLGIGFLFSRKLFLSPSPLTLPTPAIIPLPTEVIDINSRDDPELGLAGYSSGALWAGSRKIHMRLLAPDRKKVVLSSFPCEDPSTKITAVRGHFRLLALNDLSGPVIDRFELGRLDFVMDPPRIEQASLFTKKVTLSKHPRYEAFTLSFRRSCYDTEVFFYAFNDKLGRIVRLPFVRKDGRTAGSIFIPMGVNIPQIDTDGNVISSTYNPKTGWRDKVRYKFNLDSFAYKELESYSQPK